MRVGPWRAPRRFLPVALVPVVVYLALWGLVGYSLGAAGCRGARPMVPLLGAGAGHAAGASGDAGAGAVEVLVESDRFALPASRTSAASTVFGALASGAPPSGAPSSGALPLGAPSSGAVPLGAPSSGTPPLGAPSSGAVAAGAPASGTAAASGPAAGAPAAGSPAFGALAAGAPAAGTPAFGALAAGAAAPASSVSGGPIGNRFEAGWERRSIGGREVLVPVSGSGRLLAVNLGEEVARTLTLDLVRAGLPEGERLSVRTGDRELARAVLHVAALPLRVRLPEDLPVGAVLLDLVFAPAAAGGGNRSGGSGNGDAGGGAAAAPGPPALRGAGLLPALQGASPVPAVYGAGLAPALPAGSARVEGADLVMAGNCLAYLRCQLGGREALVGTFVPPAAPRPGQRFELSVELPDGTPIRRYGWRPSFWNRLRGARSFELPLRGTRGPVRVRLISRAGDGGDGGDARDVRDIRDARDARAAADARDAAGPAGRWRRLGLIDVTGQILTPGQGQ